MPAITWYVTSNLASVHQDMSETDPGTEAYASPVYGWIVSTGTGDYSKANSQVEQAASTFGVTIEPDGSIDTTVGDCWRSTNTYNGTFDTGNWVFNCCVRANTNGGAHDGNAGFRLFRSANADGTSATEITAARQEGSAVTDLATGVTQNSNVTVNITSFTVTNEYIFVQLGWERVGAGGMTTSDVNIRVGNSASLGSRVVSPNFTAVASTFIPKTMIF